MDNGSVLFWEERAGRSSEPSCMYVEMYGGVLPMSLLLGDGGDGDEGGGGGGGGERGERGELRACKCKCGQFLTLLWKASLRDLFPCIHSVCLKSLQNVMMSWCRLSYR